jgi:AcrR family transcriptional regulator
MSPRKIDSDTRREQILKAATAVFARKGFDGASMDDIVKASGLSKGGLYWHFDSKDDLIAAILAQFFDREMAGLQSLVALDLPASERLRLLGQTIAADLAGVEELASLSLEFYALAARRAEMRHFLRDYFQQYRALLAILLQEGMDAGEFVAMEADTAATTLIAQFEGIVLLWSVDPERVDLVQQSQTAVQLLLQGLLIRPATTGEAA